MFRAAVVIAVLTCYSSVAPADELSKGERAWVKTCIQHLDAASADVSEGAGAALQKMGVRGVAVMVAASTRVRTDRGWEMLHQVLLSFGASKSATALGKVESRWPTRSKTRLAELLKRLEEFKPEEAKPEGVKPAKVDPDIAERIERELGPLRESNSYSSTNSNVGRVVAMGRKAVPALLHILRQIEGHQFGFYDDAAADALTRLVEEEDLPALAALLRDGTLIAARCFKKLSGDKARDALLAPVRNGFMSHDLMAALRRYLKEKVTREVLYGYLSNSANGDAQETGWVAELVGDSGDFDAVPLLRKTLARVHADDARQPIAAALVRLGAIEAIPVLIEIVAQGVDQKHGAWHNQEAGRFLNRLVGRKVFRGTSGPFTTETSNFAEAATAFRSWWDENKSKLVFKKEYRRWRISGK